MSLASRISQALNGYPPPGQLCHWCGRAATHFCNGCDRWICDSDTCAASSKREVKRRIFTNRVNW